MNILVTGGLGFIGSNFCANLIDSNINFSIIDNLSNSSMLSYKKLCNYADSNIDFLKADIQNFDVINKYISGKDFDVVVHFAGLKSTIESIENPLKYYENNFFGTISLIKAMRANNLTKIIFSSSATVYGNNTNCPLTESSTTAPLNPYGQSKLFCEEFLHDIYKSNKHWKIVCLRYFNPVGAHISGLFGDNPRSNPSNLMPIICSASKYKVPNLKIFGQDYKTIDGTGVRDYIHVQDLADGHMAAINYLNKSENGTFQKINLGTGHGYSVLEVIKTFQSVNNVKVPYEICKRRDGDIGISYANVDYAHDILNWKSNFNLSDMCKSSWSFYEREETNE